MMHKPLHAFSILVLLLALAATTLAGMQHFSIYEKYDAYSAWPDLVRAANGDLVVVFCRSEEHMGPNGEIMLSRSTDNGKTWLPPAVIYDTILDDREGGITQLNDGSLMVHLRSVRFTTETYTGMRPTAYEPAVLERWIRYVNTDHYANATGLQGSWHSISTDSGYTWSKPVPGKDSIHGGLQLQDGSFLIASYRDDNPKIGVYAAGEALGQYKKIAEIACPHPETLRFGEPHILQLDSGRVIMMIRATAIPYDDGADRCHLWGAYSDDNGKTWSEPYETPLWGFPPHLLQLSDGRILCSYGYRRAPFGQRVCISDDGITWKKENEIILRDDAANKDLGYPASIELEPGKNLTVYYQPNLPKGAHPCEEPPSSTRRKPGILGTIWELPDQK